MKKPLCFLTSNSSSPLDHASNPIMAINHIEIDLHGDLLTRSDDLDLNRLFVWDNP